VKCGCNEDHNSWRIEHGKDHTGAATKPSALEKKQGDTHFLSIVRSSRKIRVLPLTHLNVEVTLWTGALAKIIAGGSVAGFEWLNILHMMMKNHGIKDFSDLILRRIASREMLGVKGIMAFATGRSLVRSTRR